MGHFGPFFGQKNKIMGQNLIFGTPDGQKWVPRMILLQETPNWCTKRPNIAHKLKIVTYKKNVHQLSKKKVSRKNMLDPETLFLVSLRKMIFFYRKKKLCP